MAAATDRLPLLSVVVPSYNQGRFLPDTLDSIFRQEYPRLEVVVIDGGSTDNSVEIIRKHAHRLKYWQSQKDGGQSWAINEGMRHCSGDLVAWLNSDDYYWEDSLWTVARAYQAYPDHGLYMGNGLRYLQAEGRYLPFCERHPAFSRRALTHGPDFVLQPSTFFLRRAWEEANGLDPALRFCMDWDVFIRIAARYPVAVIHEFLGVSREYEQTKTSSGKMSRAFEIVRMIQKHTRQEATAGTMLYLLDTMHGLEETAAIPDLRGLVGGALCGVERHFHAAWGQGHAFPEQNDPGDPIFAPWPATPRPERPAAASLKSMPSLSLVAVSAPDGAFLDRTLESISAQHYPRLETIVAGSEPASNLPDTINRELAAAGGEVVGWLCPGDLLAAGALEAVGRAFAADPDLDAVFGNALYIDDQDRLCLMDHGRHSSAFCYGELEAPCLPKYWTAHCAVPRSTVFCRRRTLERLGLLDEACRHVFDFELLQRVATAGKVQKLERTQAFCRIHPQSLLGDELPEFLAEVYHLSRPHWPGLLSRQFFRMWKNYVGNVMRRTLGVKPRGLRFWTGAALVAASALTRLGNPELLVGWINRASVRKAAFLRLPTPAEPYRPAALQAAPPAPLAAACPARCRPVRYRAVFCSRTWPLLPGAEAGQQRDYRFLKHLLGSSRVECFTQTEPPTEQGPSPLADLLDAVHTPETVHRRAPWLVERATGRQKLPMRLGNALRRWHLPVPGARKPLEVTDQLCHLMVYFRRALQRTLDEQRPDFLFVSDSSNPLALILAAEQLPTRFVLFAHDIEARRVGRQADGRGWLGRLACRWEAGRAELFERANLARYDGVVAATAADRDHFIERYGVAPNRVLVVEDGDTGLGRLDAWLAELAELPSVRAGTAAAAPRRRAVG
jgi:GT2 family glycosyltransferase